MAQSGLLRRGGTLISLNPLLAIPAFRLVARTGGWRLRSLFVQPSGSDLETLNQWIADGQVRPVIEHTYPLAAAKAAHQRSETERVRGKLVLVVDAQVAAMRADDVGAGQVVVDKQA